MPKPPQLYSGAQTQRIQPHRVGLWAPELQEHRVCFVLDHKADLPDRLIEADRPLQAGDWPGIRGAVLLQLHLHDVSIF